MKKFVSLLMSIVMLVTSVISVSFTALADNLIIKPDTPTWVTIGPDEVMDIFVQSGDEGCYYIYSTGNYDTRCEFEYLRGETQSFDDEMGLNFVCEVDLLASTRYQIRVSTYESKGVSFPITISMKAPEGYESGGYEENTEYSFEFIPAEPIVLYADTPSYTNDDVDGYYLEGFLYKEGNVVVITTDDGTVLNFESVINENGDYVYVCDDPDYPDFYAGDLYMDDLEGNFKVGEGTTAEISLYYPCFSDITVFSEVKVRFEANPVKHISYKSNNTIKQGVNQDVYVDMYGNAEDYYYFTPGVGDVFTIISDNVYDYEAEPCYCEDFGCYENAVHFVSALGDILHPYDDIFFGDDGFGDDGESHFEIGKNTTTVSYMGRTNSFEFVIEPTDIVSIEVKPISNTLLKKGVDSYESCDIYDNIIDCYNCPDFEITYNFKNSSSETYEFLTEYYNKGDLEDDYSNSVPYSVVPYSDQWLGEWKQGEDHQFVIFCTADIYDVINVTIDGEKKPAPTTISATPVVNGFDITWDKVDDTTGYQIQYATWANFGNAATVYGGATNTLGKVITGRAAGATYYIRVRTYKNLGGEYLWGDWSNTVCVTTPAKPAKAKLTSASGINGGFVLNWSKVSETTGYQIQYGTWANFGNAVTVYGGATNTTSKTITGRAVGATYYVRVRTYKNINGEYLWGDWSDAVSVVASASKPRATAINSATGVKGGFTINWSKVAETTGYQIQYATRSDFSNAATVYGGATNTLSKTITGRANGTRYYVRVRTYKNIGGTYVWGDWTQAVAVWTK